MRTILLVLAALLWPQAAAADVRGTATVLAGDILVVQGVKMHLHGIVAPKPDQMCRAKNKPYACGHVARTALMDLVIGSAVVCRPRDETIDGIREADCRTGGFDLAANMVHTGWAIADSAKGRKFAATEARARKAGRGLWRGEFSIAGHPR